METTLDCGHRVTLPSEGDMLPAMVPARCQPGEVWGVGPHRVIVGDATDPAVLAHALALAGDIGALIYDPPFDRRLGRLAGLPTVASFVLTDNDHVAGVVAAWGPPASVLVWDCVSVDIRISRRPLRQMKLALYYGDFRDYNWRGDTWDRRIPRPTRTTTCQLGEVFRLPISQLRRGGLPHQKPVDWVRRMLGCLTTGPVLDPFLGSGTTLVAADQLGRSGVGIEHDPAMADLAIARLAQWTGQSPERVGHVR